MSLPNPMSLPNLPHPTRRGAAALTALPAISAHPAVPAIRTIPAILVLLVAVAALAAPPPALAAEQLGGRLVLLAKDGKAAARGSDPRQAVVWFEPSAPPARAPKPPEEPFQLLTKHKEFTPRVLAVPVGSRVQFPNEDPILHNVFSVSPGNAFDLGIYRTGPRKEKRFDKPGVVRVYCNVHQAMVAYVLVLDTPHFASPAADGSFRLAGLPRGTGKLTVWHEQADPWSKDVTLPLPEDAPPVEARLVVVRPKLPPHLNKTGESYGHGEAYR